MTRKKQENKFKEDIAIVAEINNSDNAFILKYDEVKHIRRVLKSYDQANSRLYPMAGGSDELNKKVYMKFYKGFGKMKSSLSGSHKKSKVKEMVKVNGLVCSEPTCKEKDNLTIDHIQKVSVVDNANRTENLQFLCPKHHILKNLKNHKWHKEIEIDQLNKRINEIEKKGTTELFGFQVLSKDKFLDLDA